MRVAEQQINLDSVRLVKSTQDREQADVLDKLCNIILALQKRVQELEQKAPVTD